MSLETAERKRLTDDPSIKKRNKKFQKMKNGIHSFSPIIGLIFIIGIFLLYGLVYLIDGILPKPLTIEDEKHNTNDFITERAQKHLKALTSIGPRIVGSPENEVRAVEYLISAIKDIKKLSHDSHKIELDLQLVSGSYFIDYKPDGAISVYENVQNVVVKLHAATPSNNSLLINAHFDSVATSPGGSDDGINCAIMLEVLQKLCQSSNDFHHNIIFLFNGAEETPLQASHGFITQHKWAKEIGVVLNLEAAGAGGKEILFQSGPKRPWLINYYKKVPRPNGQVAGEEFFQSGVIPSDTDFRIFRDFGGIVGLDFAFDRNGYRYHTNYDDYENIPGGSYQHAGDNVLALIRLLGNAPELEKLKDQIQDNVVYFDFMGWFMISYSGWVIIFINVLVSIVSLAIACKSYYDFSLGFSRTSLIYVGLCFLMMLLSIICALIFVVILALIIDTSKFSMSWYRNTWIILGLYCIPVIVTSYGVIALYNYYRTKPNLGISIHAQIQAHIIQIFMTGLVLIGTIYGIRSTYAVLIIIFFQTVAFIIIHIFRLQYSVHKWLIIYTIFTLIPNIFLMKCGLELISLIVPICGRIGPDKNPEIIVGIVTFVLTIPISLSYAPLMSLVRKPYIVLASLTVAFFICFIIVFTPLGFPYSGNNVSPAPQRFWIYHLTKEINNENGVRNKSGFFLLHLDRNSPYSVKKYVSEMNRTIAIEDCDAIFCGLPIGSPRMVPVLQLSTWIPAEYPILPQEISLTLASRLINNNTVVYNFHVSGTNSMNIYFSSKNNTIIEEISLLRTLPKPIMWNGRSVYLVMYTSGTKKGLLKFSVTVKKPDTLSKPLLDVAITGKFMNDKEFIKTKEYEHFLSQFPEWTTIYPWLGVYKSKSF